MAGISLKRLGHNVTILERSPTSLLHSQGAGIVFGSEAQKFFKKHIKNSDLTVTSPIRQTLKKNGEMEHQSQHEQQMISWDKVYFMLRAHFDGLETEYGDVPARADRDGKAEYVTGSKVVSLSDLGEEGVEIEFEQKEAGKTSFRGDLVFAADGASSAMRKIVCPGVERTYAGYVAWRGTVSESDASEVLRKTFVDRFSFFHDFEKGVQILA